MTNDKTITIDVQALDTSPADPSPFDPRPPISLMGGRALANHVVSLDFSPFRKPDWRWRLSEQVADSVRPHRLQEIDPGLAVAVGFRRALQTPMSNQVFARHQETAAAYELYRTESHAKWQLQAWLLTGESNEVISEQSGLQLGVIERYEQLFFNVRDRLGARGWITCIAMSPLRALGELAFGWAWFAYFAGRYILEEILADFISFPPMERELLKAKASVIIKLELLPIGQPGMWAKFQNLYLALLEEEARKKRNRSLIEPAQDSTEFEMALVRETLAAITTASRTDPQQAVA